MTIPDNFKGHTFDAKPENIGGGRPKGLKNRSTILRELLALAREDGKTNEYGINEAIMIKAMSGDVAAYKEIQDTMYGKVPDKVLTAETDAVNLERDITDAVLKKLSDEDLEAIISNKDKD